MPHGSGAAPPKARKLCSARSTGATLSRRRGRAITDGAAARPSQLGGAVRTLLQAFQRDHHRVMAELGAAERALAAGDDSGVPLLAGRLRNHLKLEEEALFPFVERVVQDPSYDVTCALRCEHATLRDRLGFVERALAADDQAAARDGLRELGGALSDHEAEERRVLYPILSRRAPAFEEALALLLDHPAAER
jgi:hypothetical protein